MIFLTGIGFALVLCGFAAGYYLSVFAVILISIVLIFLIKMLNGKNVPTTANAGGDIFGFLFICTLVMMWFTAIITRIASAVIPLPLEQINYVSKLLKELFLR
ncbi:MAG: hypothetical protein G01um101448_536 [Parcubacteria group bacterium Gr01-1014_48]|nr:MAG: hypothetical protein Greene041614_636 [Parcubacteria group bacterium Greene0416_14]TSC73802.1 MAG: hypothetical protein G01um101448_536 [Parcubacteria group bacterium Gr01-1014_48]TSD01080.1 MAG: hypothetical protein Greene101415_483 [Parcubacteria group bacterium Greene1014_15]TSD08057.1 MAG: hypothetical protein Greene07144_450 [Parcubacteria group bacterium Greene0714_4]